LLLVVVLIGEPAATGDDDTVSCLPGEAGDRRGDDADAEDIGDTHAVVATDEFDVVVFVGEMRHRSSPLPLGERGGDDVLLMQLPMVTGI